MPLPTFRPLSEPSVLKKKFDDIFDATKYTKALTSIKGLVKDQKTELTNAQTRLGHAKSNKEKSDEVFTTKSSVSSLMHLHPT